MPTFRRRPLDVEAIRVGEVRLMSRRDRPTWIHDACNSGRLVFRGEAVLVRSPQGDSRPKDDDWIVQGIERELYVLKDAAFHRLYEKKPALVRDVRVGSVRQVTEIG